jgi:hypothetical protein
MLRRLAVMLSWRYRKRGQFESDLERVQKEASSSSIPTHDLEQSPSANTASQHVSQAKLPRHFVAADPMPSPSPIVQGNPNPAADKAMNPDVMKYLLGLIEGGWRFQKS